jgi:hypothetical protein
MDPELPVPHDSDCATLAVWLECPTVEDIPVEKMRELQQATLEWHKRHNGHLPDDLLDRLAGGTGRLGKMLFVDPDEYDGKPETDPLSGTKLVRRRPSKTATKAPPRKRVKS